MTAAKHHTPGTQMVLRMLVGDPWPALFVELGERVCSELVAGVDNAELARMAIGASSAALFQRLARGLIS